MTGTIIGPALKPNDCTSNTCCTFDTTQCSVCFKDSTFLFIKQHKLWNDMYLKTLRFN